MSVEGFRRLLTLVSVGVSSYYLVWRLGTLNEEAMFFSVLLYSAELYGFLTSLLFFYMVWRLPERKPPPPPEGRTVDVFIPTLNESPEILRKTILGALEIRYPHRVFVLDDGNRPEIRRLCEELGAEYIARTENTHGKAGNLNHALERTDGEFIAVFDADHVPLPDFLDKTLGYFRDEKVAFVQTPQDFYNVDSYQHRIVRNRLWHEQSLFFRVIMRGKDRMNASFFCGSCAVIRRKALEDIGGFATGTVTEDLHTSIRLHARGWKSVYHPETLAYGVAPPTFKPFRTQRERWGQGAMQVFLRDNPLIKRGLSLSQRLNYFASMTTYFDGFQKAIFYTAPVVVLLTGTYPISVSLGEFLPVFVPHLFLSLWAFEEMSRGYGKFVLLEQYNMARFVSFMKAVLGFFSIKRPRFRVTDKENGGQVRWSEVVPQTLVLTASLLGILYALFNLDRVANRDLYVSNMFWAGINLSIAALCVLWTLRKKHKRKDFRFPAHFPATVESEEGVTAVAVEDLHEKGCALITPVSYKPGSLLEIKLAFQDVILKLGGRVLYVKPLEDLALYRLGVKFEGTGEEESRLIVLFNFRFFLQKYMREHDVPSPTPLLLFAKLFRNRYPGRRSRRFPIRMPGLVLAGEEFIPYASEDVSDEGMKILTYRRISSDAVHVNLGGTGGYRILSGKVVWSKEISFYGIKAYRYGLWFERTPSAEVREGSFAAT